MTKIILDILLKSLKGWGIAVAVLITMPLWLPLGFGYCFYMLWEVK